MLTTWYSRSSARESTRVTICPAVSRLPETNRLRSAWPFRGIFTWEPPTSTARTAGALGSNGVSCGDTMRLRLLVVAAELLPHRGEHLVGEVVEVAGREARVERRRQHRRRDALLDRRDRRPASLARVGDVPAELLERRRLVERLRGEIEQPRADDAPAPPH